MQAGNGESFLGEVRPIILANAKTYTAWFVIMRCMSEQKQRTLNAKKKS